MKIDGVQFDNVTITSCPHGEVLFDTPGTYSWTVPPGVTSISAVAVGGGGSTTSAVINGGGGGGALAYANNFSVTPGDVYNIDVATSGADSFVLLANPPNTIIVFAGGGLAATGNTGGAGGSVVTGTGGAGGNGGSGSNSSGGGGAGGYSGTGGTGGAPGGNGTAGAGGGGGGGAGVSGGPAGGGGGVGVYGLGGNGTGGIAGVTLYRGGGGSGGFGSPSLPGGKYGGGSSGGVVSNGGTGAVRIIWPGTTRQFPSTNVGRIVNYGDSIPYPLEMHLDASNPSSLIAGNTSFFDLSGNGNNANFASGANIVGPGISFNGSQQGFFGDKLGIIAGGNFSVGVWFRFPTLPNAERWILGRKTTTGNTGDWAIRTNASNQWAFTLGSQSSNGGAGGVIPANTWYHVTVTVSSGGNVIQYINGVAGSPNGFSTPVTSPAGFAYLAYDGTNFTAVDIGECFFYRRILSSAEAIQIYNNTRWKYS